MNVNVTSYGLAGSPGGLCLYRPAALANESGILKLNAEVIGIVTFPYLNDSYVRCEWVGVVGSEIIQKNATTPMVVHWDILEKHKKESCPKNESLS